jgi:hypothetical protein
MGAVESKPRGRRDDRGYGVVDVLAWVWLNLNPHPLKTEGAAPKVRREGLKDGRG